jgi:hypothetical protein
MLMMMNDDDDDDDDVIYISRATFCSYAAIYVFGSHAQLEGSQISISTARGALSIFSSRPSRLSGKVPSPDVLRPQRQKK